MAKKKSSKRGGASAPAFCKRELGACMTSLVRAGANLSKAGKVCMTNFAVCRGGKSKGKSKH